MISSSIQAVLTQNHRLLSNRICVMSCTLNVQGQGKVVLVCAPLAETCYSGNQIIEREPRSSWQLYLFMQSASVCACLCVKLFLCVLMYMHICSSVCGNQMSTSGDITQITSILFFSDCVSHLPRPLGHQGSSCPHFPNAVTMSVLLYSFF